jgi:hypothetical protein
MSPIMVAPSLRRGFGVALMSASAVALTTKVAQSTPMERLVLKAARSPPTAGPMVLPMRLFANGRTAFMAGKRSSDTISGVKAAMHG